METARRFHVLVIIAAVLLLRLPFLDQAIQGDDVYYLAEAEHAQIEPAHPLHFRYVFLGNLVDMRGHSHPPLNAWCLAALLALLGDIREAPFHAAYIAFSLIAALAMWSLARRFSPHPLWATLLFLATPAFVINGTSLESDLPFLAFWMAAIALFTARRYTLAALAAALAALTAFQAIFLTPILLLYERKRLAAWIAALAAPGTLLAWQLFERLTTGALPASVLTGYFQSYGFQAIHQKLHSAALLAIHACWLVFPLLLVGLRGKIPGRRFLWGWIAIFFAGAVLVFFAGSARYLLPMAAPVALLVSSLEVKWLRLGFAAQMALSLSLASVNYQHWNGYRRFVASLPKAPHRLWINGDWGLRYYLESEGGLPMERNQSVRPGDMVVTSALAFPAEFTTGGGALTALAETEIRSTLPLRLIGLDSHSGYSTSSKGWLPFGVSSGPIDRVKAELVVERPPELSDLTMSAAAAPRQIVTGVYRLEDNRWRWMAGRAVILLKSPETAAPVRVVFYIPEQAPGRRVRVLLDGEEIAAKTYAAPGVYTLESQPRAPKQGAATLAIEIDKTFSVPGDSRELGMILTEAGFAPAQ